MNSLAKLAALAWLLSPSISYFHFQRAVQVSTPGQSYIVVDDSIWKHARPDLGDLRLYAGEKEIAYALVTESGTSQRQRIQAPVLQQSSVAGKTQFLINMSDLAAYDHVGLDLATRDFVAHARVEGSDELHGRSWAGLGDSILYDLSKEGLGSNSTLRLPTATYRYLRVTLDGPVKPEDVRGATSELGETQPAVWRDVSQSPRQEQQDKQTLLTFDIAENVPVERAIFEIDAAQPNFQRRVEIQNEKSGWLAASEISRIHMVRGGQKVDSEDLAVPFSCNGQRAIRIIIHNGDDPPLKITGARLQQTERRLYFAAPPQTQVVLFYGDEKLERPVYDYAKLFQRDKGAVLAQLDGEVSNPAYAGRPDDRPWSERHPAVLWVVLVAAVVSLGAVALRSVRRAAAPPNLPGR